MEVLDAPRVVSWVLDAPWMPRWIQELVGITFDGCQLQAFCMTSIIDG